MRSLEKKGMLMKAVQLGIPWLMAALGVNGSLGAHMRYFLARFEETGSVGKGKGEGSVQDSF